MGKIQDISPFSLLAVLEICHFSTESSIKFWKNGFIFCTLIDPFKPRRRRENPPKCWFLSDEKMNIQFYSSRFFHYLWRLPFNHFSIIIPNQKLKQIYSINVWWYVMEEFKKITVYLFIVFFLFTNHPSSKKKNISQSYLNGILVIAKKYVII